MDMANCLRAVEESSVRFRKVLRCPGCVCSDGAGVVRDFGSARPRGGSSPGLHAPEGLRPTVRASEASSDCSVLSRPQFHLVLFSLFGNGSLVFSYLFFLKTKLMLPYIERFCFFSFK